PRSVQGPLSIPRIWSAVHHQPTAASTKSSATRPRRVRMAENAGPRSPPPRPRFTAGAIMLSRRPGELGCREPGLAFVLDAERVDSRALCFGHGEVRPHRMEHSIESDRLTGIHPKRNDVLDLELDRVADTDAVKEPVVADLDGGALDTEHLTHQRSQRGHWSSELTAEDPHQLVELLVGRVLVDEDTQPPVPVGHDLR